jgi:hypothetical protein
MLEGGYGECNHPFAGRAAGLRKDGDSTCSDGPNPFAATGSRSNPWVRHSIEKPKHLCTYARFLSLR